ncbi:asparagine synthase (glutamine-hydrolyzing) [Vibrio coralliilyticus]|uniref:asparagine synthase (glutamine-hydrolyzing) n=1 Tax=Vibrio coralliilyticus TaxID=190893 RepID=UPI0018358DFF|nr:asparagine synthase (glutamine-hydrolyzing) [Vibrio coralliilyticus]NUW66078.1 asparagine synthase (glutamine-hydrolyzing) [Vibrio coralliilyticus]
MCGFAGIFNYLRHSEVNKELIATMTNAIQHRGPDDSGVFVDGDIGLGFARLSIIDPLDGFQPMRSIDGRYSLVFNGEIYNYRELRKSLSAQGYSFRTQSDTEVILALFETGEVIPEEKLHGMFAFALYDSVKRQLILSRDRMGKKPLFWSHIEDGIAFGSEIKSLLKLSDIQKEPNWRVLSDFLTLSYCPESGTEYPETAFEGIFHVPPGGRLIVGQEIKKQIWWKLPSYLEKDKATSINWEDEILNCLRDSVQRRLVSDAPLGIFLSGGLDSALILALIAEHGVPDNFTAFTASFESSSYDENEEARKLAEYFGIQHVSVPIVPSDIERIFQDVVYKSDNLIANPAIFANYILSESASPIVKSVLHGGGGDELFFGYPTYRADEISKTLCLVPKSLRKLAENAIKPWPVTYKKLGFKYKFLKLLEGLDFPLHKRHYWWRTILTEVDKDSLLLPHIPRHDSYQAYIHAYSMCKSDNFYEQAAYADMKVWWQYMGLYQGDSMSMANSLELRMPFMDQDLIELMARIPMKYKFDGRNQKALMKRVCRKFLPNEVLNRPKSGFHIPLAEWFAGPLREFVETNLSYDRVNNIQGLDFIFVKQVIDEHFSRRHDNSFKIVNLLVLVEWYHQFILSQ